LSKKGESMRTISITLEDEVYLVCNELIRERKLSTTVNELLKNFLSLEDNEFFAEKESLTKEKESLNKRLSEVTSKLTIIQTRETEAKKKAKQQTLQVLKGMRANNPLRDLV